MAVKLVTRKINYYEISIEYNNDFEADNKNPFAAFISEIIALSKTKAKIRYQNFNDNVIFLQSLVDDEKRFIQGKILCVRKDIFPEIIKMSTEKTRGVVADDDEDVVETTHFVIDYSKKKKLLAIESNQVGAKMHHLMKYLDEIGMEKGFSKRVSFLPFADESIENLQQRIGKCSEFVVRVHRNHIKKIKELDQNIFNALDSSVAFYNGEYGTISLKFDYKAMPNTEKINTTIIKLFNAIQKNENVRNYFHTLSIKSEDNTKNNLLEAFDLIVEKTTSILRVQKKEKYRTVISTDFFPKIKAEIIRKKLQ